MAEEVMLDLETLGTGNNAVILSIGAVKFDPYGQGLLGELPSQSRFEAFVDPATCVAAGMQMDANTVMWWLHPDRAPAREVLNGKDRKTLSRVLLDFASWMGDPKPVWGNGSDFDNVILRNAYTAVGQSCPWKYHQSRCFRTIRNLYPDVPVDRVGVYHSAVDDAATQALHLQAILRGVKQ